MWIKPEVHKGGYTWWSTIQQDEYVELVKKRMAVTLSMKSVPNPFRIVLKTEPPQCVAEGPTLESLQKEWTEIEDMIRQAKEHNVAMGKVNRDDMLNFLLIKFQCMTVDFLDSEEQKHQQEEEQKAKDEANLLEYFQTTFNLKNEKLITTYVCSIWEKVPKTGTLYVSQNYVCFNSPIVKRTITTPFVEIRSIQKESYKGVQTIKVVSSTEEYWLVAFKLQEILALLEQLWDISMKRVLKTAEQTLEEIEAQYKARNNSPSGNTSPVLNNSSADNRKSTDLSRSSSVDVSPPALQQSHKDMLGQKQRNKSHQNMFRLPSDENLLKEYKCMALKNNTFRKGNLYLSSRFLCFESLPYQTGKFFSFVIALQDIEFMAVDNNPHAVEQNEFGKRPKEGTIHLSVGVDEFVLVILKESRDAVFSEISEAVNSIRNEPSKIINPVHIWSASIVEKISRGLLEDRNNFSSQYKEREEKQQEEWKTFFAKYGNGLSIIKSQKMRHLIREGVPNNIRARVWMICSGAYALLIARGKGYYDGLVARASESGVKEDIEKDLHRSLPEHEFYQTEEGINSLRRVLTAFSLHNPVIGYCQSMNIVCALFLLFMPEEHAFFLLCALCEQLVPDYYVKAMIGSIVDQRLFEEMVTARMPHVAKHLEISGLPLPLIALPWFMCIFIGYVPLESALRILDCFFGLEGPPFLFPVALSLFKLNEQNIIQERDGTRIATVLKSSVCDPDDILPMAFMEAETLTPAKLNEMRNTHRAKAIREMETKTENTRLRELKKTTNFTPEELTSMYTKFVGAGEDYCVNFEQFEIRFLDDCPWWSFGVDEIFKLMDKKRVGLVDVTDYLNIMSIVLKGTTEDRIALCFRLYDGDSDGYISKDEYEAALNLLYKFSQKLHEDDLIRFDEDIEEALEEASYYDSETDIRNKSQAFDKIIVARTFREADVNKNGKLSLEEFQTTIKHPIISLILNL